MAERTLRVDYLARVEGEGALHLRVRGGAIEEVRLEIFEPPRFFEALLRGRSFRDAPDITSRICGICPVAYQMSAVHALEAAARVRVGEPIRGLRRLLYCGEWIESHALHLFLLHAPDFLGYPDAVSMARDHADLVRRGLRIKKAGNALMTALGGREVHPINVRVGGFFRAPARSELRALLPELEWARDAAIETAAWTSTLDLPEIERPLELVALRHPHEYPFCEGRLVSTGGLDIAADEFERHFRERQVPHSNALHCRLEGERLYLVGPLARYGLNFDRLGAAGREAARRAGLGPLCRNPFRSIAVRAVEIAQAADEAVERIRGYAPFDPPAVPVEPRSATGCGITEAPRGILYHRYRVDERGDIEDARIVPPTSQNQDAIEDDLRAVAAAYLDRDDDELRRQCERAIRNHDPCISCATHFLRLEVDRG